MKTRLLTSVLLVSAALLAGCNPKTETTATANSVVESNSAADHAKTSTASAPKSGIELGNLDTQIRPQQDFFRYVNGNWLQKTEIPADRARWGSFDELRALAEQQVLTIVQQAAKEKAAAGTDTQKIGDLYRAFMDTAQIDKLGITPLDDELKTIASINTVPELVNYWGQQQAYRAGTPVMLGVGQDQMNSSQYIIQVSQGGLGLPDRDYYLKTDEKSRQIQEQYQWFIANLWQLAGLTDGKQAAERIFKLEQQLAQLQWSRVQNRDRKATYNKVTLADLQQQAPGIDWLQFAQAALGKHQTATKETALVVRQPTYLTQFASLVATQSLADWQNYLRFHLLRQHAEWLSAPIAQAHFDFYGRTLSGLQQNKPRERQAVDAVEQALGFMVGQRYVEAHFKPEAKARMDQMIKNLKVAFADSIKELEWMSDATKTQALDKLAKFNTKIGYPSQWRDYSCVTVDAADLVGTMQRSAVCEYQRMIERLGKPVDRAEWGMTPQTVNAYYSSTLNEIVFPAAILQPPFFNVEADDAVNYGAIGGVIGHEITHGFDDQGRRSDGDGNLRDWWTEVDEQQFKQRAQLMIDQYNAFNPIDDLHLQGALGLGENIADLGGLTVAYRAYQNSLGGQPAPVIDGFSGDKRFFIGWAQVWRIKFRDEALRQQVITGPHSPGMYRVLGVLSNMPEFYRTYDVKPGDGMYRPDPVRVKIW